MVSSGFWSQLMPEGYCSLRDAGRALFVTNALMVRLVHKRVVRYTRKGDRRFAEIAHVREIVSNGGVKTIVSLRPHDHVVMLDKEYRNKRVQVIIRRGEYIVQVDAVTVLTRQSNVDLAWKNVREFIDDCYEVEL